VILSSAPQGGFSHDEKMERNFGEWLLYECDGMKVCTIKYPNKKKSGIMPPNL
jgi:hypothetical protein